MQHAKSKEGFTCMIVVVDYLTKWVEAEPLPDKTASTVAAFLYSLICRHGCANVQINDQGREFVNEISSHLHRLRCTAKNVKCVSPTNQRID